MISSLAMRFYFSDGWTRELVESYVRKNSYSENRILAFDIDKPWGYYVPSSGTQMEIDKLFENEVSGLRCAEQWGELRGLNDLEILRERNR